MQQHRMPPGPKAAPPRSADSQGKDNRTAKTEKWPPHMLRANEFRPNHMPTPANRSRRGIKLLAIVAVASLAGIGSLAAVKGHLPVQAVRAAFAGSPAQDVSAATHEQRKLARTEASTLSRVLSDLRIVQSAFANLQGQIANLPAKSTMDSIGKRITGINKSLASVESQLRKLHQAHASEVAAIKAKIVAADKTRLQDASVLEARIKKLERLVHDRVKVARANTSRVGRTERSSGVRNRAGDKSAPGYVLREVHRGIAVVENRSGDLLEVYPGMYVPGAGRVRSIRRRGGQWVVVTSRGTIDSQAY